MRITTIQVKNFRCFTDNLFTIDAHATLITGNNGSGKTSLLEALYFGCYLRSFRTHIPKELIRFESDNNTFFIKLMLNDHGTNQRTIQIGFNTHRRIVSVDQTSIHSYKELLDFYRVISLTHEDLNLVTGSPEKRRMFLDQALIFYQNDFINQCRIYKNIIDNRNALLAQKVIHKESYDLWTERLWHQTTLIQKQRIEFLCLLQDKINNLIDQWFGHEYIITYTYKPKKGNPEQTFNSFLEANQNLQHLERKLGRSLFGAHLDDFIIHFGQKNSKDYASRGQQKLVTILFKAAQLQLLTEKKGPSILLIDDFMSDFDHVRAKILFTMLTNLPHTQLIFTSPSPGSFFDQKLPKKDFQLIQLTT